MFFELLWLLFTVALAAILACSSRYFGREILPGLLAGSLVVAVFIAGKLGDVALPGVGSVALSASIVIYSMTFLYTDVMSELQGRLFTQSAIIGAALCYPVIVLSTYYSTNWAPSQFYADQDAFETVMTTAVRVTIASLCSFAASQLFDIWAFEKIRIATKGKMLWLRNNGSTSVSQLIDTVIFYTIAFYGLMPNEALFTLMLGTYLLKLIIAIIDTPFVYFVVWFVRAGDKSP
ncbi:MAG: queuosine precursor transporter [Pseudomonadota bacterium]